MDTTDYGETLFVSAKMTLFQTVICCGPQEGLVSWYPWLLPEPPKEALLPVALIRGECAPLPQRAHSRALSSRALHCPLQAFPELMH